jgi:DNA invertase Pin-like site-specific DNA recombinase
VDEGKSGATFNRPALRRCLKALKPGDTLTVWKLDRLGRAARDLLNLLHDLDTRKIHFQSLTEAIDTHTPTGRAMLHFAAMLAELERSVMVERTQAGLRMARARGAKFGRKVILTPQQIAHAREEIDSGKKTRSEVAALFKVSRSTLYRALLDAA